MDALDPYFFTDLPNKIFDGVSQFVIETAGIDSAVREYADRMGIGPWWVGPLQPPEMRDTMYYGKPEECVLKIAIAFTGPIQWVLVEPKTGKSIYMDFLKEKNGGIHYVTLTHGDIPWEEVTKRLQQRGYECITTGRYGGNRWFNWKAGEPTPVTFEALV
ncbi:MAG: VOC family protein, partial [Candidatus Binatia bacterium]